MVKIADFRHDKYNVESLDGNSTAAGSKLLKFPQCAQELSMPEMAKVKVEPIDETVEEDWKMLTQLLNEVQFVNPEALKIVDSMIEDGIVSPLPAYPNSQLVVPTDA